VIDGLDNGSAYLVLAYAYASGVYGTPSNLVSGVPVASSLTPSAAVAKPLDRLADMLAASDAWQSHCSAASATEARLRVHLEALDGSAAVRSAEEYSDDVVAARPFAVVALADALDAERIANTGAKFLWSGAIYLDLETTVPDAYAGDDSLGDAMVWFHNLCGDILEDLADLAMDAGRLPIRGISLHDGPFRAERGAAGKEGDWVRAVFRIEWSP
jgi:hypothetical protein